MPKFVSGSPGMISYRMLSSPQRLARRLDGQPGERAMTIGMSDDFASFDQRAVIKVCGIGGGGGNAVNRMIAAGMQDVDFILINTDAMALKNSPAPTRVQIGNEITGGLGSGAKPDVGERAALEDREHLNEILRGADMVFLTSGLGGGTGTGASPVVAEIASSSGALTVAIVTLPFAFEGDERMENALRGLGALEQHVDSLIVVPNERVAELGGDKSVPLLDAFYRADEVLHNGVRAITELITVHGLINVDFADVRTIMQARGRALMGIGRADGDGRAVRAAEEAIVCPLLEQSSIDGAMGVIVNIKGGCDIGMREVQEAVATVKAAAHPLANIIFGAVVDEEERPELQVTVIAAGFQGEVAAQPAPVREITPPPRPDTGQDDAPETDTTPAVPDQEVGGQADTPGLQTEFPVTDPAAAESAAGDTSDDFIPAYKRKQDEEDFIPAFMRKRKK